MISQGTISYKDWFICAALTVFIFGWVVSSDRRSGISWMPASEFYCITLGQERGQIDVDIFMDSFNTSAVGSGVGSWNEKGGFRRWICKPFEFRVLPPYRIGVSISYWLIIVILIIWILLRRVNFKQLIR